MPSQTPGVSALEIQANRFTLVSRLADDLAHEIKNPLHAMVINLELVKRRALAGDADAVVQRADMVTAEVMRLNAMLDQLLQLLRPMRQADPVSNLDAAVDEVLPLLAHQARLSGVDLVYEAVGRPVAARIRKDALKLTLLNLVADALDRARASGGRVEVRAAADDREVRLVVARSEAGSPSSAATRLPASAGSAPTPDGSPVSGREVVRSLAEEVGGGFRVEEAEDGGPRLIVFFPRGAGA